MKCPIDGSYLTMTERQGIEIDYCPKCRGVWLDRGELDKIIDRATVSSPPAAPVAQPTAAPHLQGSPQFGNERQDSYRPEGRERRRDHDDYDDDHRHDRKPKRRESFLGDLFDF